MTRIVHPIAGTLALLTILTFWLSTVFVELFGSTEMTVFVKEAIPWGFLVLIPALAVAGGSGRALNTFGLAHAKVKRMRIIAPNGVLVLVPSAFFLAWKAGGGQLDAVFYAVQAIELLAGALNIALLSLNMRDGLRLTGRMGGRNLKRRAA
ncbi:hypothetical protein [Notoacmeibacter ruber]|uniref:Uncharacterized protein n=1 Tax=Notoacmeibacter ruber TaxID=2670375 RepID=A0A3L7JH69_9HYPH|nr:hypothetical protein [Notoacmeibacter ruber]RLQ88971.1 hypothetical protein D8780_12740 [Notoacmeibacter ruber]